MEDEGFEYQHLTNGAGETENIIIIIIKRISRAPIYHTRWQHRVLYNNTNHTHTHIIRAT